MSGRWVDLREAAERLGASTEAIRKRATRGSLESRRENGRVLVWVDEGRTEGGREDYADRDLLYAEMRRRIEDLQKQLEHASERDRENRRIIAALTSRIPAIEAPQEPSESAQPRSDGPTPTEPSAAAQKLAQGRSWWERWFGG